MPVTIFSGYLGSGKTTIILNLIAQLSDEYKVVWLKNEYGDFSVDSELAKEQNIEVKEMLNGCLCCVLVGKLGNAVTEILQDFRPDRIIIESSGTAFPGPILIELAKIPQVKVDGVVNVVDALNFDGYPDKGQVAKMQAGCTNLIIINKSDKVDEEKLEAVKDEIYELNPGTPKLFSPDGRVDKNLLLGLDSRLLEVVGGILKQEDHSTDDGHEHINDHHDHPDEVEVVTFRTPASFDPEQLLALLDEFRVRDVIRIKGVVRLNDDSFGVINWVYGGGSLEPLVRYQGESVIVFMGKHTAAIKELISAKLTQIMQGDDRSQVSETI